jgi:hypothetical protein
MFSSMRNMVSSAAREPFSRHAMQREGRNR